MSMEYVNIDEGLARVRGNKKLFRRMLSLFDASEEFNKLEAALSEGDYQKAGEVAHAIKGMTGNLSMTALSEISAKLMTDLRGNVYNEADIEEYRRVLLETRSCVAQIEAEIDAELA